MARDLWLLRARSSPKNYNTRLRPRNRPPARPPTPRPMMRMTPLGAHHRLLRIQTGNHPHLQKIHEAATTYDANSRHCHQASLERNDTSCLPKKLIQALQKPSPALSPCHCSTPCTGHPTDSSPPCRNALNRRECTAGNCSNRCCTNRLTAISPYMLPALRVVSSERGIFGYALFNPLPLSRDTFLGNVYGEILTRRLLAERKHAVTRSFVLDYRFKNLCLDLTWSSNHFCHLSHSCNPNTRLELWQLGNQPAWKAFTNCDIPSNHLLSIDFRLYDLPCTSPCICNAPSCSLTLPDPTHSICSVINRTHPTWKQTTLAFAPAKTTHAEPQHITARHSRAVAESTSTQGTLSRYITRDQSISAQRSLTRSGKTDDSSLAHLSSERIGRQRVALHHPEMATAIIRPPNETPTGHQGGNSPTHEHQATEDGAPNKPNHVFS
jgi:hypothetical protein